MSLVKLSFVVFTPNFYVVDVKSFCAFDFLKSYHYHNSCLNHVNNLRVTSVYKNDASISEFVNLSWTETLQWDRWVMRGWSFPGGAGVKSPPASEGDIRGAGSFPASGRSPGGGTAAHSRILAWRILGTEEPGGLWSTGSQSQTRRKRLSTHTCSDVRLVGKSPKDEGHLLAGHPQPQKAFPSVLRS